MFLKINFDKDFDKKQIELLRWKIILLKIINKNNKF